LIYISEDYDAVKLSGLPAQKIDTEAIRQASGRQRNPERTLILGWNWRVPTIIEQLDAYVASGSEVMAGSDFQDCGGGIPPQCPVLKHQIVTYRTGDTTDRRTLDKLDLKSYDHVITLCSDRIPEQKADAQALITLLHLRDIADRVGHPFSIVSEMLDLRNRA